LSDQPLLPFRISDIEFFDRRGDGCLFVRGINRAAELAPFADQVDLPMVQLRLAMGASSIGCFEHAIRS